MKKAVSMLVLLIAVLVILATARAFAQEDEQERVPVKVKNSQVATGVVIVNLQKDAKDAKDAKNAKLIQLQCNEGATNCKALPSGNYLMVELPPNYGMYDCKNVEIYRGDPDKPDAAEKVGSYCLVEK